jgi:hypothetical protein
MAMVCVYVLNTSECATECATECAAECAAECVSVAESISCRAVRVAFYIAMAYKPSSEYLRDDLLGGHRADPAGVRDRLRESFGVAEDQMPIGAVVVQPTPDTDRYICSLAGLGPGRTVVVWPTYRQVRVANAYDAHYRRTRHKDATVEHTADPAARGDPPALVIFADAHQFAATRANDPFAERYIDHDTLEAKQATRLLYVLRAIDSPIDRYLRARGVAPAFVDLASHYETSYVIESGADAETASDVLTRPLVISQAATVHKGQCLQVAVHGRTVQAAWDAVEAMVTSRPSRLFALAIQYAVEADTPGGLLNVARASGHAVTMGNVEGKRVDAMLVSSRVSWITSAASRARTRARQRETAGKGAGNEEVRSPKRRK